MLLLNVIVDLAPALIQTFLTIIVGYLFGRLKLMPPEGARYMGTYVAMLALPALLLRTLATLDFSTVEWSFFFGILIAKSILFVITVSLTLLKLGTSPKAIANAGIFAIFTTQSNDFAMGLPILTGVFQNTHPQFPQMLFFIAPISLILLNPIGFLLMEYGRTKQLHSVPVCSVLSVPTPPMAIARDELHKHNKGEADQLELTPSSPSPLIPDNQLQSDDKIMDGETQENLDHHSDSESDSESDSDSDMDSSDVDGIMPLPAASHAHALAAPAFSSFSSPPPAYDPPSGFQLLRKILWNVFTNPVVVCTFLGIAANFAFKSSIPGAIDSFLAALGNSFSACALFVLGLGIGGNKLHIFADRTLLFLPLCLILAKLIVLPIIIRLVMVILVSDSTAPIILCAFIVGTIPTAPSVHFFATQFTPPSLNLIGPSMILCTFISAPLMFVSSQMITVSLESDQINTLLSDTTRISSAFGFLFAFYLFICLLYNHRYRSTRDRLLLSLVLSQMLYCSLIQICVLDIDGFGEGLRYQLVLGSQYSVRICLAFVSIHELIRHRVSLSDAYLFRVYVVIFIGIMLIGVGLPQFVASEAPADLRFCACWNKYGKGQMIMSMIVLSASFVCSLAGLVKIRAAPSSVSSSSRVASPLPEETFGFGPSSFRSIDATPFINERKNNDIQTNTHTPSHASPTHSQMHAHLHSQTYEEFWTSSMQVFYILNLCSMFLSIALTLWSADTNGIRIELMLFDAVLFSIHGVYTFALFGLTKLIKSPMTPIKRKLRKIFNSARMEIKYGQT